jgi:hypothetical protein
VDFSQVSYPNYRTLEGRKTTLKPGDGSPAYLDYGDVTGDGDEEAFAVLPIETRGTAIPHHVYIYSFQGRVLTLLWDFETCDRADGGLRKIYAENTRLVVELYGRDKRLGTNLCADDRTGTEQPYPYLVTRSRFSWINGKFQLEGSPETFSDSDGYGSPLMRVYKKAQ